MGQRGSISFLIHSSIVFQIQAADISPKIAMEGIIESFKIPVVCAFVLIIALIFWYFNMRKWESLNTICK